MAAAGGELARSGKGGAGGEEGGAAGAAGEDAKEEAGAGAGAGAAAGAGVAAGGATPFRGPPLPERKAPLQLKLHRALLSADMRRTALPVRPTLER